MRSDKANDALGLGGTESLAGEPASDSCFLDPELAVGVDHDLDHGGIGEGGGDGGSECGAQHLPAPSLRLLGQRQGEFSHDRWPPPIS